MKLLTVPDGLLHSVHDCAAEMTLCKQALGVQGEGVRQLRNALRETAFGNWASCDFQGVGAIHFKAYPKANAFVYQKNGLSCSEWTAAIKLSTNYANLRGVPANKKSGASPLCRRCHRENETPFHVIGACSSNDARRNHRHNKVKHALNALLSAKGYVCIEEARGTDSGGGNRFIDLLAFDPGGRNLRIS
jgi:hypothetical protein